MSTAPADPIRRLAELAGDVAANAQHTDQAVRQVGSPQFLQELGAHPFYPQLAASLTGGTSPDIPEGFATPIGRALIFLTLKHPDWDVGLDILDQAWHDAQLMPLPIAVGESIRDQAPGKTPDDRFFFFHVLGSCYHRTPWAVAARTKTGRSRVMRRLGSRAVAASPPPIGRL